MNLGVPREQGWRRHASIDGLTHLSHIREDILVLLLERCHHCHHTFDQPRPSRTRGPTAAFAPQDPWADRTLGRIVGRLPSFDPYTCPQGVVHFEQLATDPLSFHHTTALAGLEQLRHIAPNRTPNDPQ